MTTKNQQTKQNSLKNEQKPCMVCGRLTDSYVYFKAEFCPCHIDCYNGLRQRGSQELETVVAQSVI